MTERGTREDIFEHPVVRLCELYEDLGPLQPNLEFQDEFGNWKPSGLVTGRVSRSMVGRYREILEPNATSEGPPPSRHESNWERNGGSLY